MIESEESSQLDAIAVELTSGYKANGVAAFVLRTLPDGNVRLLGPGIERDRVVRMLRAAADAVESGTQAVQVRH